MAMQLHVAPAFIQHHAPCSMQEQEAHPTGEGIAAWAD
jgi:hypothetical protein